MRKTKNGRVVMGGRRVKWRRMGFNGVHMCGRKGVQNEKRLTQLCICRPDCAG